MNVEITVTRGEIPIWNWNPEFMRRLEAYLEEHPEAGAVKDPNCLYRKLREHQSGLIGVVSKIVGEEADEPFTITVRVEGKPKKYGPGPVEY